MDDVLAEVLAALPAHHGMPDVLVLGDAELAARLLAARPGLALLVVDAAPHLVAQAVAGGVPAKEMDPAHLLMADDSYDVVVALDGVASDRVLSEVHRVLRPGGRLVT